MAQLERMFLNDDEGEKLERVFINELSKMANESLDLLDDMIEVGAQIDDCFDEFQVLKGEIKKLIKEAEEIIEGINNL